MLLCFLILTKNGRPIIFQMEGQLKVTLAAEEAAAMAATAERVKAEVAEAAASLDTAAPRVVSAAEAEAASLEMEEK